MTQYIDKNDLLVAEIVKCYNECLKRAKIIDSDYWNAKADAYRNMLVILDSTLEVKEMDFGTEVYKYIDEHFNVYDDGNQTLQNKDKKSLIGRADIENIAKYFFELGLKTKVE